MIQNITYKHVAHVVMLAFAAASLGNVHEFFASAGHDGLSAWALAGALGAALVTISIMLTHIDREADTRAWATLAMVGVAVAVLSGSLQAGVYLHTLTPLPAFMLGYGIPLIGEVALAFGVAAYEKAEQRREVTEAGQTVERIAVRTIVDVMQTVDVTRAKKQAERKIESLIVAHVGATVAKLTPPEADQNRPKPTGIHQIDAPASGEAFDATPSEDTANAQIRHQERPTIDVANEARAAEKADKVAAIVPLLTERGPMGVSAIAEELGVHRDTARRYLTELEQLFCVVNNNRKWQIAAPVSWPTLPENTVEAIHLNGAIA